MRLSALMEERGISQAELGRRVGISQSAIHRLTSGQNYGSKHLHRIARELGTSPAYLSGETDDPHENAPPPAPLPRIQHLTMQVAMPSERALKAAFQGLLMASRGMDEDELAHELAKRLPTILRVAADAVDAPSSDEHAAQPEPDLVPDDVRREPRQATSR